MARYSFRPPQALHPGLQPHGKGYYVYLSDLFALPANLGGTLGIFLPDGIIKTGLSAGIQLLRNHFDV